MSQELDARTRRLIVALDARAGVAFLAALVVAALV